MKCFYFVYGENDSVGWNSYPTHRHLIYEEAMSEAIRLSTSLKMTFYVLKAVSEISPPLDKAQVKMLDN